MIKKFFAGLLALICGASFACKAEELKPNTKPLSEIKKEVQEGKAILVDVREEKEWDAGHVKDAKLVPLSDLKSANPNLKDLPKDKTIYTYCVMGKRSLAAAGILKEKGYNATSLNEGYDALTKEGFESAK